jgi:hypothetical protein
MLITISLCYASLKHVSHSSKKSVSHPQVRINSTDTILGPYKTKMLNLCTQCFLEGQYAKRMNLILLDSNIRNSRGVCKCGSITRTEFSGMW